MWRLPYINLIGDDEQVAIIREGTDLGAGEPVNYVDGKPVKRLGTAFLVRATLQPLGGKELLLVPEADRCKEMWSLWSYPDPTGLEVSVNDQVLRGGNTYQVQAVEEWGSYRKSRLVRCDVPASAADIAQAAEPL